MKKVYDLDVGELKTVPIDFIKLNDVTKNEVRKNAKLNTVETKVNKLDKQMLDPTTLIYINRYNADKQNLKKKIGDID